jgi:hypothetical protein
MLMVDEFKKNWHLLTSIVYHTQIQILLPIDQVGI